MNGYVVLAIGTFLLGLMVTALEDLVSEEVRGRIDRLPLALLTRAVARLPEELRDETEGEWRQTLDTIHAGNELLPITRSFIGVRYAVRCLRQARRIGRNERRATAPAVGQVSVPAPQRDPWIFRGATRLENIGSALMGGGVVLILLGAGLMYLSNTQLHSSVAQSVAMGVAVTGSAMFISGLASFLPVYVAGVVIVHGYLLWLLFRGAWRLVRRQR